MKKRFLSAVFGLAVAGCLAVGGSIAATVTAENKDGVYGNENVADISQFMSSTDFLSARGLSFNADEEVIFSRNVGTFLNSNCGISFTTKFASSSWKERGKRDFRITLGENELHCTLDGQILRVDAYNRFRTQATAGQYLKAVAFSGFSATEEHTWRLARVYTTATGDNAYALRLYMDGKLVIEIEDDGAVIGENASDVISILNYTGVAVSVRSGLENKVTFDEERNVLDLLDFTGSKALFSWSGEVVSNGSTIVDMPQIPALAGKPNGLKWKMRSASEWASGEALFEMKLGGTEIALVYDANTNDVFADIYAYSTADGETQALGGRVDVVADYDVTAWHLWRVVCVDALNGDGFAVRFYVDDTLCQEVYTIGDMDETFSGVRLINNSGMDVACKSGYYTCPLAEEEVCSDITVYNTAAALTTENGLLVASGAKAASLTSEATYQNSAGVEFAFKASADWASAVDGKVMNVAFGATEIRFGLAGNALKIGVYNNAHTYGVWGSETILNGDFDETAWHTVKITRRKFERPNGANKENGFIVNVYIDGVKVVEKYEVISPMWSENYKALSITNVSGVDVAFKKI